jgi:hypothetical protein
LDASEAAILQWSLVDFLAYGPEAAKFPKLVNGFKPDDGQPMKTFAQALEAAEMTADKLDKSWREWAAQFK